ncbi:MAG: conjugative transposon protein TraM [Bacteroidales bacterium]|jgi:hypothetical protein|nr:conjugative transposon protein TraM [Bacteroidales bacterium]
MNQTLKIKIIVFAVLGILALLMIFIVFSFIKPDNEKPVTSLRDIPQSDFTWEEMMKVDGVKKSSNEGELSSYAASNHDGLIDTVQNAGEERNLYREPQEQPIINTPVEEPAPQSVPATREPVTVKTTKPAKVRQETGEEKPQAEPEPVQVRETTAAAVASEPAQVKEEVKKRRRTGNAFHSVGDNNNDKGNVIKAAIHDDQTVISGSTVKMRTLESFDVDGVKVPANTFIYGVASLQENRVNISITSIRMNNNIYTVSKSVFDNDGLQGIFIPYNAPADGASELKSDVVTDVPVTTGTGVVGTVVNSAVQTTKNVIRSSTRENKVTLKANYSIYLK